MAVRIQLTNLAEVLAGFEKTNEKIRSAAQVAIAQTGLAIERQAKINASNGVRRRVGGRIVPPRHIGPSGEGPNVISGNLRRSITTKPKSGFGDKYVVEVSASMVYARAVEKGLPQWNGVKYPYLEPAATRLRDNGTLNRVFRTYFANNMRG